MCAMLSSIVQRMKAWRLRGAAVEKPTMAVVWPPRPRCERPLRLRLTSKSEFQAEEQS